MDGDNGDDAPKEDGGMSGGDSGGSGGDMGGKKDDEEERM